MKKIVEAWLVVRALRAAIYGECSDDNWRAVRDNWTKPENVKWLSDEYAKIGACGVYVHGKGFHQVSI